jgi:hypothetical protein
MSCLSSDATDTKKAKIGFHTAQHLGRHAIQHHDGKRYVGVQGRIAERWHSSAQIRYGFSVLNLIACHDAKWYLHDIPILAETIIIVCG